MSSARILEVRDLRVEYASSVGFLTTRLGPPARVPFGVIEVMTVHRNGKSITTAPSVTPAYKAIRPGVTRRRRGDGGVTGVASTFSITVSRMGHPLLLAAELEGRDEEDDGEEQPREC